MNFCPRRREGILLEESDHEQANMFIRTIKMINERKDETIRQLLNASASSRQTRDFNLVSSSSGAPAQPADAPAPPPPPRPARSAPSLAHNEAPGPRQSRPSENETAPSEAADTQASQRQRRRPRRASPAASVVVKLEPVIEFLGDRHSSLEADSKVCQLIESGVRAIVGPKDGNSIQHVQSICDNLEIPYFELRPFLGWPANPAQPAAAAPFAPRAPMHHNGHHHSLHQLDAPDYLASRDAHTASQLLPFPALRELVPGGHEALASNGAISALLGAPAAAAGLHHYADAATSARHHQSGQQQAFAPPANVVGSHKLDDLSLNLYPPAHLLNSAYIDLIYALNWTSFAIVYEDGSSMIKLQDLFRESSGSWTNRWRIKLFRHDAAGAPDGPAAYDADDRLASARAGAGAPKTSAGSYPFRHSSEQLKQPTSVRDDIRQAPAYAAKRKPTFRDVFWHVKASGEKNILLDVKTENLYEALKHAQQVGLMTEEYSYLVTSLDLHMIDLEDFKYSRTKITAFSILQVPKSAHQQRQLDAANINADTKPQATTMSEMRPARAETNLVFDEQYLERLGVHVIFGQASEAHPNNGFSNKYRAKSTSRSGKDMKYTPPSAAQRAPPTDAGNTRQHSDTYRMDSLNENDLARREMLQSSPASMGLLPTVDRNNEQRLFEFFVEQQDRNLSHVRLSTPSAILHDSLMLLLLGLSELDPSGAYLNEHQQAVACSLSSQPWPHGSSLVNYMRRISFTGLTGQVSFDGSGLRTDFRLNVIGLAPNIRQIKVGEWASAPEAGGSPADAAAGPSARAAAVSYEELSNKYELELRRYTQMLAEGREVVVPYSAPASAHGSLMVNEIIFDRLYREQADQLDTLTVTAKLSQPYFMLKETPNRLEGNNQYEGFAVDLIHELSKLVNFKYKWRVVGDNKYGSKEVLANGTVVWNGMIGEIVRGTADLAIVDLTITAQREEAVDFTLPFMNTGISILFKKPTTKVTTLFSFLSPFSSDVWAYVLAAYCGISAILYLVGHLSPYEWANPHPCRHAGDDDDTVLKNQFSLLNSFWFTIGSLMQQGSDLTPRSMSTRTIAGIWYFFTLIMISSYTANLAAFLTVEKVVYPIENVRDLSQQQEIKYGCVESGSTCTFFHDSQIDTYKRIDETMSKYRTYVRSNDEGQKRVGEGKFAFFMESTTIEYIIERNCNLTQIGGLIDSKGYGLATSKKSRLKRPYRTLLNEGILHLQETGMLHVLKNRWWKERRGGGTCTDDAKGGGVTELSLANVGGVFVVLLGGLGISFLVAIAEFMWRARRSGSSRDRMCEEMMNDLKFALACKSSMKPIARAKSQRNRANNRRLVHQQTSSMSQCDDLDPSMLTRAQLAATAKDCDPILMHAMITMLMQQQHQQQQALHHQQQQHHLYPPPDDAAKQVNMATNEITYAGHPLAANNNTHRAYHQQRAQNRAPSINGNADNMDLGADQPATQQQCRWISQSDAGRRRLLFAQQTVDDTMADESLAGAGRGQAGEQHEPPRA